MEKDKVRETKPEARSKDTYTYGDYLNWLDDERWELIDGVPYNMTPAVEMVRARRANPGSSRPRSAMNSSLSTGESRPISISTRAQIKWGR